MASPRSFAVGEVEFNPGPLRGVVNGWKGRFTAAREHGVVAHREMAEECAREVQAVLKRRIKETGRNQEQPADLYSRAGRDRLVELIMDPQNHPADEEGFTVGVASFLDSTSARPYWRNLETGTPIFEGRILQGWFITPGGRWVGPNQSFGNARLIQVSEAELDLRKSWRQSRDEDGQPRKVPRIMINRPIPAYRYFEVGGKRFFDEGKHWEIYQRHGITERNR